MDSFAVPTPVAKLKWRRCYCGNTVGSRSRRQSDTMCDRVCIADFKHACGGLNMLSLYEKENDSPSTE